MVPLTKNETDPLSPAVLGTPPLRWQGLPILCESTCKVGEDTSCADGLRNLQSIKKNLLKTCYLDLISGNIWLSITSGCGSHSFQFVSHYLASSAPWTLCPKMGGSRTPTNEPASQAPNQFVFPPNCNINASMLRKQRWLRKCSFCIDRNYLLFHQPLLDWIVEQMNEQKDTDKWEETAGGSTRHPQHLQVLFKLTREFFFPVVMANLCMKVNMH